MARAGGALCENRTYAPYTVGPAHRSKMQVCKHRHKHAHQQVFKVQVHADGTQRDPESLLKRVFMHRREVKEEMLLKYYHYENPHIIKDEIKHRDENPLQALAQQQRARRNLSRSNSIAQDARSITGLPMLNPTGMVTIYCSILILFVDGIYTALWVPVEAAFNLSHDIGTPTGTMDFCVGVILCMDIFIRFHVPIELTSSFMTYMLKQVRPPPHLQP